MVQHVTSRNPRPLISEANPSWNFPSKQKFKSPVPTTRAHVQLRPASEAAAGEYGAFYRAIDDFDNVGWVAALGTELWR